MARVLVIEDSADLRDLIAQVLLPNGHVVTVADDGEHGLALQRADFGADVLVTDIFMPNRDGIEVIVDFKREYPDVKIIAMSGGTGRFDGFHYLVAAEQAGADVVLHKPFEIDELLAAIARL